MRKKQADEEKHGLELTEIAAIILEKDILPSMASKPVIRDVVEMDLYTDFLASRSSRLDRILAGR